MRRLTRKVTGGTTCNRSNALNDIRVLPQFEAPMKTARSVRTTGDKPTDANECQITRAFRIKMMHLRDMHDVGDVSGLLKKKKIREITSGECIVARISRRALFVTMLSDNLLF